MSSVLSVNEMMKGTWSLKCTALDEVYDKCGLVLPYSFTSAKKHNKINSLKKSLKGGYVWGSYKVDDGSEFNKKNNDIQYINCIYDQCVGGQGQVVEKIIEKEVVVEKVVGRYDHYKESTWNELVSKTKENKKLKKKVAELEAQVKEAMDGYEQINEKIKKAVVDFKFNKHLDDLLADKVDKVDMVVVDKPTTAEIETQTDLISEDDQENNWFNYQHIKSELEEMTKIRYASQKKNQRLEEELEDMENKYKEAQYHCNSYKGQIEQLKIEAKEELATAKETIKDMAEQLKSKPEPAPAFDIPVVDGEEIEVCSSTTIRYKGDVYWTKPYIEKKMKRSEMYGQKMKNEVDDLEWKLDSVTNNLEGYRESFRDLKKENQQLQYKLDKGDMYSKKELMERCDRAEKEVKKLENTDWKSKADEWEAKYDNERWTYIQKNKKLQETIDERDEELSNAYEELDEANQTLQQYKDHGY